MFYFVYILRSEKDKKFYIGFTTDVNRRFIQHNSGEVESTKNRWPLELIFYEAFRSKNAALKREKYFKTTKGKLALKYMLKG